MVSSLEQTFTDACSNQTIPGVVLQAIDRQGKSALRSNVPIQINVDKSTRSFQILQILRCALVEGCSLSSAVEGRYYNAYCSCTKLMTAIAVMQCVEKGKLSLDEDVSTILHELRDMDILTGFDQEGQPKYRKATRKITLRYVFHPRNVPKICLLGSLR